MKIPTLCCAIFLPALSLNASDSDYGMLIFEDQFERSESQELKDEPGNEWTTSSDKTAAGNKEVDLRDGVMYIYTHKDANHATSVRHAFEFTDGTIALRFKLESEDDSLMLNFADLGLKTVHAGHLFKVLVSHDGVEIADQKTGEMNLELRNAKKNGTITSEQKKAVLKKGRTFDNPLSVNEWHQIYVSVEGEKIICLIDDEIVGSFSSEGFAHETKTLLRLLVARNAYVDDVRIWRKK